MEFFDLVNISERYMELVNPSSPEKVITLGKFLGLKPDSRVIDFGCGFAEPLILWAEQFGIHGIGIDVREYACERARQKVAQRGLTDRIEIVQSAGADYVFEEGSFDVATCIGATFIWGGFVPTIRALKRAVRPGGRIGIGEPYWLNSHVPAEYVRKEPFFTEYELLQHIRAEGFDLEYVVRASHDDWARYESDNWHGLLRWLEENPHHPERAQVKAHMRQTQDDYFRYSREHLGWAMYALAPSL